MRKREKEKVRKREIEIERRREIETDIGRRERGEREEETQKHSAGDRSI